VLARRDMQGNTPQLHLGMAYLCITFMYTGPNLAAATVPRPALLFCLFVLQARNASRWVCSCPLQPFCPPSSTH
jgi:hypothetical protein